MTRAPSNLIAVRSLLLQHLNRDPGRARDEDLEPNEVGIVGDAAHRGGYHCGSDRVVANDYSVVESPRDRNGLTLDAAALDVGTFRVNSGGRTHNLFTFSTWCAAQCVANAPDTRDIREIIYSPDGNVVRRWDRLGRRSTGDRSHLWHTHFSFFRDAIKANRDQRPLFRRYLTTIGLLSSPPAKEDAVPLTNADADLVIDRLLARRVVSPALGDRTVADWLKGGHQATRDIGRVATAVTTLTARDGLDERQVAAELAPLLLAALTPAAVAAAIPEAIAGQVADELARRLATKQG